MSIGYRFIKIQFFVSLSLLITVIGHVEQYQLDDELQTGFR